MAITVDMVKFDGWRNPKRNVGKVVEIAPWCVEDDPNDICIRIEGTDGSMRVLDVRCCLGFVPQIGDTVVSGLDESGSIEGWIIFLVNREIK